MDENKTTIEKIGEEHMTDEKALTGARQHYVTAHIAHYITKEMKEALQLYQGVMAEHPGTREAADSRTQIQNIAQSLVPEQELLAAQIKLTLARLDH